MEYAKIIAITGLPGLYEMLNSKGDGAIVRSLDDQSTRFVSGRVHQFTHLESIEVYTERENVNLIEVFTAMRDSGESLPDEKDGKALTGYFEKVYPSLDFDRVYTSDMKKMVKWFTVLKNNEIELKLSEPEAEEAEETEEEETVEVASPTAEGKEKPAKKAKAKKEKEETEEEDEPEEKKPAKQTKTKAAAAKPKKAKEEEEEKPKKAAAKKAPAKKAAAKKKK